jgi:hypothetical protein
MRHPDCPLLDGLADEEEIELDGRLDSGEALDNRMEAYLERVREHNQDHACEYCFGKPPDWLDHFIDNIKVTH